MDSREHWSTIYQTKAADEVSWYQTHPTLSLEFIQKTGVGLEEAIIDVGAGASNLVDHLVRLGYQTLTVLDISPEALRVARERLKEISQNITWIEGDITTVTLPENHYAIWHDRAVFHFLTDVTARQKYIEQVYRSVKQGGHVIVATFASDGPEKCSGLNVVRYDAPSLHGEFGSKFELIYSTHENHHTPWGSEQKFIYCYCRI